MHKVAVLKCSVNFWGDCDIEKG